MSFDSDWDKIKSPVQNPSSAGIQGTYPNLSLTNVGTPGTKGSGEKVPKITVDAHGRVTNIVEETVVPPDLSPPPNSNLSQPFGSPTAVPVITVDQKGRVTSVSQVPVSYPMPAITTIQVTGSFSLSPSQFGKTLLLEQADAPFLGNSFFFVAVNPAALSSVAVGDSVVIRISQHATALFAVQIGGTRPARIDLAAGESVMIQKVSSSEYVVRDVVQVLSLDESYFGYIHRLYLDYRVARRQGAKTVERPISVHLPGLSDGQQVMRRCHMFDGRIFVEPWTNATQNTYGYSTTSDGAFLDLSMGKHPNEFSTASASVFMSRNLIWRVRDSGSTPASLYWQYMYASGGYASAPPDPGDPATNFYGLWHQYLWYSSNLVSAYGFLNVPSSVYSIVQPVDYHETGNPYPARYIRWSTTASNTTVANRVSVLTQTPVIVVRVARDVFLVTSPSLSAYVIEDGVWKFRLTYYVFDGRWEYENPQDANGALDRMFIDTVRTISIPLMLNGWVDEVPYFPTLGTSDGSFSTNNTSVSPLVAIYASHSILYFVVTFNRVNYPGPFYGVIQVPYYIPSQYPVVADDQFIRIPTNPGLYRSLYPYNYNDKASHIVDTGIAWGSFYMYIERGVGPPSNPWSAIERKLLTNGAHGLLALYPIDMTPLYGAELIGNGSFLGSYAVVRQEAGQQYIRVSVGQGMALRAPLVDAANSRYAWSWRPGSPIPGAL